MCPNRHIKSPPKLSSAGFWTTRTSFGGVGRVFICELSRLRYPTLTEADQLAQTQPRAQPYKTPLQGADVERGDTKTASHESDIAELKSAILAKLTLAVGKDPTAATDRDWFIAAALTVRDRIVHQWLVAERMSRGKGRKRVYYLSLEFLMGRLFDDVLGSLRLGEIVNAALGDLGVDLARLRESEPDAALGNGGLGRLAACFLESTATLGIAACGYGIRYDHGLFRQVIRDGWQQEYPEEWLSFGNPWEFERPEATYDIQFGGRVERTVGPQGIARSVCPMRQSKLWPTILRSSDGEADM
jgi:hypothetical protein